MRTSPWPQTAGVLLAAALLVPRPAQACNPSVGDFVWADLNRNGIQDPGEPGIANVRLTIEPATQDGTTETFTNADGFYVFPRVQCYVVSTIRVDVTTVPAGYSATPIILGGGGSDVGTGVGNDSNDPAGAQVGPIYYQNDTTIDFGFVPGPPPCFATVGDRVWYDQNLNGIQDDTEPGLAGVEVRLRRAGDTATLQTALTDGQGLYQFQVSCGSYEIEIVPPPGYALTTINAPGSTVANDSNGHPSNTTPPTNGSDLTVDFGLVHVQDVCPPVGTVGLPNPLGTLYWGVDAQGNVTVRYDQSRGINDNSYGTNIVQWPRAHNFTDLVGSDKAQFVFRNAAGAIVLDFALDYLSTASGTSSGYKSLGATGGDGRMNAGQASWILWWDTSLAQNLNDTGYCVARNCAGGGTNLLANSPPTVAPDSYALPAGSPYVAWNFTDAYYMRISAAAFGTSGFGSVMVGEVHDSPPKIGTNAVTPAVCDGAEPGACDVSSGAVTVKDKQVKWALTNDGSTAAVLSQVSIAWPSANGKLSKVKFDGDVVWDGSIAWSSGGATLTGGQLAADARKKRIDPGRTRIVIFEFERNASPDLSLYAATLSFGSGCEVTMPNATPPLTGNFCTTAPGTGRAKTLTLAYTDANGALPGSNCAANCNQQDAGKVIVTGDPNNASPVYLIATPTGKTGRLFEGSVLLDGQFTMVAANAGLATVDTNTTVYLYAAQGGALLSTVQFHTSCSQPLNPNDYYGSLQLIGFTR